MRAAFKPNYSQPAMDVSGNKETKRPDHKKKVKNNNPAFSQAFPKLVKKDKTTAEAMDSYRSYKSKYLDK